MGIICYAIIIFWYWNYSFVIIPTFVYRNQYEAFSRHLFLLGNQPTESVLREPKIITIHAFSSVYLFFSLCACAFYHDQSHRQAARRASGQTISCGPAQHPLTGPKRTPFRSTKREKGVQKIKAPSSEMYSYNYNTGLLSSSAASIVALVVVVVFGGMAWAYLIAALHRRLG